MAPLAPTEKCGLWLFQVAKEKQVTTHDYNTRKTSKFYVSTKTGKSSALSAAS